MSIIETKQVVEVSEVKKMLKNYGMKLKDNGQILFRGLYPETIDNNKAKFASRISDNNKYQDMDLDDLISKLRDELLNFDKAIDFKNKIQDMDNKSEEIKKDESDLNLCMKIYRMTKILLEMDKRLDEDGAYL